MTTNPPSVEMDLHCLELRFADTRVHTPTALHRLADSIEQVGQQVPVTVVVDEQHPVLIDGYLRVRALQRCGLDTAQVNCWSCSVEQALLTTLAHQQARCWEALEEANLLHILRDGGLSQREMARQIGRDVSWVSRRLRLRDGMSEDILSALRCGDLSTWSATRILMPLARANADHADLLLASLKKEPLSSRDLSELYQHYDTSDKNTRERLVRNPQLFAKAQRAQREALAATRLKDGPEGEWTGTLSAVGQRVERLIRQVPTLFTECLDASLRKRLLAAYQTTHSRWQRLTNRLSVEDNPSLDEGDADDQRGKRTDHTQTSPAGGGHTPDLQSAQGVPQCGAPNPAPTGINADSDTADAG